MEVNVPSDPEVVKWKEDRKVTKIEFKEINAGMTWEGAD